MRILVTSASGANGNGYGAVLGFGPESDFTGPFSSDPRVADPRGLSLDPSGALVCLNSGEDRVLALDLDGYVVRDSGRIPGLDPGGAEFGPDGRLYCVGEDHVVAFDFRAGSFIGPVVHLARLNGQALVLLPI